jgi:hypothetical protein
MIPLNVSRRFSWIAPIAAGLGVIASLSACETLNRTVSLPQPQAQTDTATVTRADDARAAERAASSADLKVSATPGPPRLDSIDIQPLVSGKSEVTGYAVYTYLIMTSGDPARATSAVCGFVKSRMSETGDSTRDDPKTTALYYLPQRFQKQGEMELVSATIKAATANYDDARAASYAARMSLPPSIYLITYVGEPLPNRPTASDDKLDIVELGGLSPTRVYQYVRAYRDQLTPGGQYWKSRTLRQIGIDVADKLSLVNQVKTISSYMLKSAQAMEAGKTPDSMPKFDDQVPAVCKEDQVSMR